VPHNRPSLIRGATREEGPHALVYLHQWPAALNPPVVDTMREYENGISDSESANALLISDAMIGRMSKNNSLLVSRAEG